MIQELLKCWVGTQTQPGRNHHHTPRLLLQQGAATSPGRQAHQTRRGQPWAHTHKGPASPRGSHSLLFTNSSNPIRHPAPLELPQLRTQGAGSYTALNEYDSLPASTTNKDQKEDKRGQGHCTGGQREGVTPRENGLVSRMSKPPQDPAIL